MGSDITPKNNYIKSLLDKDVKDVIAYLQTGRYRIVNNIIITENGYSIKRKGSL